MALKKLQLKTRRHARIRAKISGTTNRPRLVVYRSIRAIHAQLVDDTKGRTLCGYSDMKLKSGKNKTEKAKEVGLKIAELAKGLKVEAIVFDRNGYKYHGRVKALAEGAREGGLKF
jgi:large subunit ribosomal protein L18